MPLHQHSTFSATAVCVRFFFVLFSFFFKYKHTYVRCIVVVCTSDIYMYKCMNLWSSTHCLCTNSEGHNHMQLSSFNTRAQQTTTTTTKTATAIWLSLCIWILVAVVAIVAELNNNSSSSISILLWIKPHNDRVKVNQRERAWERVLHRNGWWDCKSMHCIVVILLMVLMSGGYGGRHGAGNLSHSVCWCWVRF